MRRAHQSRRPVSLCSMGMEIYKEFLRFFKLNKLQLEDNSLLTPLYGIKAVKEVGIGSDIIFDDKYLIPFFAFLKKKH